MVKGFTLIELLIVIGILAILATTVVLVLNPATILQETRDTQRLSDLSTLNSAIGLYLATVSGTIGAITHPDLAVVGVCRNEGLADNYWATKSGVVSPFVVDGTAGATMAQHANIGRLPDGTGWIPVNLTTVGGGSPVPNLPIDPSNTGTDLTTTTGLFYVYTCGGNGLQYEINVNMESGKFGNTGPKDVESTDGGNQPAIYETGSGPGLAL